MNETDTCRELIEPKLREAGWESEPPLFADPDFDGEPLPPDYESTPGKPDEIADPPTGGGYGGGDEEDKEKKVRKFYVQGGEIRIIAHIVYELDVDGKQMRAVEFTAFTAEKVRKLYRDPGALLAEWSDPVRRQDVVAALEAQGVPFDELAAASGKPDADPFDLLCHFAFGAPVRTRRERADALRQNKPEFFAQYGPVARAVLEELLVKYTEDGLSEFVVPDVLKVPPISDHGSVVKIAEAFGGSTELRHAVGRLQQEIYSK